MNEDENVERAHSSAVGSRPPRHSRPAPALHFVFCPTRTKAERTKTKMYVRVCINACESPHARARCQPRLVPVTLSEKI